MIASIVMPIPAESIVKVLQIRKSDDNMFYMANKRQKDLTAEELPDWTDNVSFVSDADANRWRNLAGVIDELIRRHGDGWDDSHLKAYIVEKRKAQLNDLLEQRNKAKEEQRDEESKVKAIVTKYLERYENPSPNDLVGIQELARMELTLSLLDNLQKKMMSSGNVTGRDIESISKSRKDTLTQFQALERSLEIDRKTRSQETDTVSVVQNILRRSKELIDKRGIQLVCQNCADEEVKINQGLVLFHFDQQLDWDIRWICPRCFKENQISHKGHYVYESQGGKLNE